MSEMRLQKYLARAGVASRRACEELIAAGHVSVNGHVVSELGAKVDADADEVTLDGARVEPPREAVTIMLHKPAGYVTTMSDPQGRPCVAELVPKGEGRFAGLYPVGRLDADTTGLLLFSTDGELGNALLHPRMHVEKLYLALVEGTPDARAVERLSRGVRLSDGMTAPAEVRLLEGAQAQQAARLIGSDAAASGNARRHGGKRSRAVFERSGACAYVAVGLREGRKRQVRRMLEAVGHPVVALHRASFGPLSLGDLPRGQWRELTSEEAASLRSASGAEGRSGRGGEPARS